MFHFFRKIQTHFKSNRLVGRDLEDLNPGVQELIEESKEFDIKDLSMLGQIAHNSFTDGTKRMKEKFGDDMYSTDPGTGLMSKALGRKNKGKDIRDNTNDHFGYLIDNIGLQFEKRISEWDQAYQENLKLDGADEEALRKAYMDRLDDLSKFCKGQLDRINTDVRDLVSAAGGEEGGNDFIDTKAELDIFNRNFRELLANMDIDPALVEEAFSGGLPDFDMDYIEGCYAESLETIQSIQNGKELNSSDYDKLIGNISIYFDSTLDTTDKYTLEDSVQGIENSGHIAVLHAMSPAQCFVLGNRLIQKRSQTDASKGIRFLLNMNFLGMAQAETLLAKLDPQYAIMDSEVTGIEATRDLLEDMRRLAADSVLKKNFKENFLMAHGDASTFLSYEVGRVVLLGAMLPFIFKIKDPGSWSQIMSNPFWLGAVAGSGLLIENATGGFGEGAVTDTFTKATMAATEGEDLDEDKKWEELTEMANQSPEVIDYMMKDDGALLTDIETIVDGRDESTLYRFKFEDQVMLHMEDRVKKIKEKIPGIDEDAAAAQARTELESELIVSLDRKDERTTERAIDEIYFKLAFGMGGANVPKMIEILHEANVRIGTEAAPTTT